MGIFGDRERPRKTTDKTGSGFFTFVPICLNLVKFCPAVENCLIRPCDVAYLVSTAITANTVVNPGVKRVNVPVQNWTPGLI